MNLRSKSLGKVLKKFLWIDIGLTTLLIINTLVINVVDAGGNFWIYDGIVSILLTINIMIYTIIYLVWLFKVHKDLQDLNSTYPITPGGALGRVLIPFYNLYGLWNVYSTMANHFKNNPAIHNTGLKLAKYVPFYYILQIVMNTLNANLARQPVDESFNIVWFIAYIGDIALVVMYILILKAVSTGLFELSKQDREEISEVN